MKKPTTGGQHQTLFTARDAGCHRQQARATSPKGSLGVAGARRVISDQSFCTLKFAAQLNRLAVWHNESRLYGMTVRVNHCEHHIPQVSSPRASGDIDKTELDRLSIRRHLPLQARPISGVTIMGREQTIPVQVEHSDFMVWRWRASSRLMQNCGATGCGANCEVDRDAHNRTLPRTRQGFHFLERLLRV